MADFDEDQHPRDERGRFTGSGISFWASNRQKQAYQEKIKVPKRRNVQQTVAVKDLKASGFSKADGPPVGKVEGRARDIEVPLIRKTEGFIPATSVTMSMKDAGQLRPIWDAIHYTSVALERQKHASEKEAVKAYKAFERYQKQSFVGGVHKYSFNEKGEIVNQRDPNDKTAPAGFAKIKEKRDAAEARYKELKREREVLQERGEALFAATRAMSVVAAQVAPGDTVTFSRSLDHGWSSIHVERADGSELAVHVDPGRKEIAHPVTRVGGIYWTQGKKGLEEGVELRDAHVSVEVRGPLANSKDRRWHTPIHEAEADGSNVLRVSTADAIRDFFKVDPPPEPESDAPNVMLERAKESSGGHVWKPTGKTIGDYDKG